MKPLANLQAMSRANFARHADALPALVRLQAQVFHSTRTGPRPVPRLLPWLLDPRNLRGAWERVRSADGADTPGVDGVTCPAVARRGEGWLAGLAEEVRRGRYEPAAPRWVKVPKSGRPGALRTLGVLTVRDRVVHAALKQVLEPVLEPMFVPGSFGFRPGRGVRGALGEAVWLLSPPPGRAGQAGAGAGPAAVLPFGFAGHLDVANCFDTIDHELLLEALGRQVGDADVLRLVGLLARAGGALAGPGWPLRPFGRRRWRGLVQGGALSPLLCNLYLHRLDVAMAAMAREEGGGVRVLRYADDLLLLARDGRASRRAVARVRQVLGQLRQSLRGGAAPGPAVGGVDWLGVRLLPRPGRWGGRLRFGYVVPDQKVAAMLGRVAEMTAPPVQKIDAGVFDLGRWVAAVNEQLREWHDAYAFADNAPDVFRAVDEHALDAVGRLLRAVTGKRFEALREQYRVWLPRGFWTWQVNGSRLMVLSSLAPERPGRLTRPPAWSCYERIVSTR